MENHFNSCPAKDDERTREVGVTINHECTCKGIEQSMIEKYHPKGIDWSKDNLADGLCRPNLRPITEKTLKSERDCHFTCSQHGKTEWIPACEKCFNEMTELEMTEPKTFEKEREAFIKELLQIIIEDVPWKYQERIVKLLSEQ